MTPLLIIKTLEGFVVIEDEDATRLPHVMVNKVRAFNKLDDRLYISDNVLEFVRKHFTQACEEPKS